jgi:hypothetical protein
MTMPSNANPEIAAVLDRLEAQHQHQRVVALEVENGRLRAENDVLREALRAALAWVSRVVSLRRKGSRTDLMMSNWEAPLRAQPTQRHAAHDESQGWINDWVEEKDLVRWVEYAGLAQFRNRVLSPLHDARVVEYDKVLRKVKLTPIGSKDVETRLLPKYKI